MEGHKLSLDDPLSLSGNELFERRYLRKGVGGYRIQMLLDKRLQQLDARAASAFRKTPNQLHAVQRYKQVYGGQSAARYIVQVRRQDKRPASTPSICIIWVVKMVMVVEVVVCGLGEGRTLRVGPEHLSTTFLGTIATNTKQHPYRGDRERNVSNEQEPLFPPAAQDLEHPIGRFELSRNP